MKKPYKTVGGIGISVEEDNGKKVVSLATRNWSTWLTPNEAKKLGQFLLKLSKPRQS